MCAASLLDHGARVIVTTRRGERASDALAELRATGSCELIVADLSTPDGPAALGAAVRERVDRLDILVNNAGVTWGARLDAYPADAWTRVLQLNVAAAFGVVQATLDLLEEAGRGTGRLG